MTRRIALASCVLALLGAAVAHQTFGRATTRAARPTMISPTVAQQQPVSPLVARAAVGEASVTLTTLAARERSPSTPRRTATPTRDGSLTVGQDKRADAPARSDVVSGDRTSGHGGARPDDAARGPGPRSAAAHAGLDTARYDAGPASDPLQLSRICFVEAEFSAADCIAIASVLRIRARRAGVSIVEMGRRYSAIDRDNDRARFARELPAGDLEEWSSATNERWQRLRRVAALALAGRLRSSCAGASHWGGLALQPDARRAAKAVREGLWRRVQCGQPVQNAYFAELPARAVVAASEAGGAR